MDFKKHIEKNLQQILSEMKFTISPKVEHPTVESHGDYTTNIAMQAFKQITSETPGIKMHTDYGLGGSSAKDMAEKIAEEYRQLNDEVVERVEVAGPGFINFFLSKDALLNGLKQFDGGMGSSLKSKKIMIEYTDPNPFKEFHIGHLFTNAVGETLARLFESQGAEVKRANYQGDVGMHVAKAIWGIKRTLEQDNLEFSDVEAQSLAERASFLGRAYAVGAVAFEEDEKAKAEIVELNKKIYQQDEEVKEIYQKGKSWSLEAFEQIYKRLGTKFDFYYFESDTGKVGEQYVRDHIKDGVFEESQGAIIFPGEKHGLHSRVFINSQGLPTYEAKDLGLAETKYKDFAYDESYIVTGNEIKDYFKVIIKALSLINPDLGSKVRHIAHGMVRLPSGKMSSRTGKVIKGEWLLDEAKNKLLSSYPEMGGVVADKVAVGAIKWALLKSQIGSDITFDFEQSLSFEGDSGPYIQYTYARTQSVLARGKGQGESKKKTSPLTLDALPLNSEELALLRYYYRYPEVIEQAAKTYAPNLLANYLFELAQKFNHFYNTNRILEAEDGQKELRLALTKTVGGILQSGLALLGIEAPERM